MPKGRALRGSEWLRHEENVAKFKSDNPSARDKWDIGFGDRFLELFAVEKGTDLKALERFSVNLINQCGTNAITLAKFGADQVHIYVRLKHEKKQADICTRNDFVDLIGDELVDLIDGMFKRNGVL